jgi:hypothetical protein
VGVHDSVTPYPDAGERVLRLHKAGKRIALSKTGHYVLPAIEW